MENINFAEFKRGMSFKQYSRSCYAGLRGKTAAELEEEYAAYTAFYGDGKLFKIGDYYVKLDTSYKPGTFYVCDIDGIAKGEDLEHDHIDRYETLVEAVAACKDAQ